MICFVDSKSQRALKSEYGLKSYANFLLILVKDFSTFCDFRNIILTLESPQISTRLSQTPDKMIGTHEVFDDYQFSGNIEGSQTDVTGWTLSFLFTSFTFWTWLKQPLNLPQNVLFVFWWYLEIWRLILDNLFGKPLALTFQNTPWITDLKNKKKTEEIQLQKNVFVSLVVCYTMCGTLLIFTKKLLLKKNFYRSLNFKILIHEVLREDNAKGVSNTLSKIPHHIYK